MVLGPVAGPAAADTPAAVPPTSATGQVLPQDLHLPQDLDLSDAGVTYLLGWEGFRAAPYDDATGNCTIGNGHLIHRGICTDQDRAQWGSLTRDQARELAHADIESKVIPAIRAGIPNTPISQNQFDALVDWAYNVGPGYINGKSTSSVRAALLATPPRYGDVPAALMAYVYSGQTRLCGLYRRRIGDGTVWSNGSYLRNSATCPQDYL
ncbi:lysozyme [Frankia sp. AiPa1]|uniref:lysozyme n=1 Tax=Frankia sp. AiPa1 TaxID=573492 RepID=UPI00202B3E4F|nr:lysozyme [Frankia sp. AiPa1]MCL9758684.1 lysozyme [Frankia sp. AiPa1]